MFGSIGINLYGVDTMVNFGDDDPPFCQWIDFPNPWDQQEKNKRKWIDCPTPIFIHFLHLACIFTYMAGWFLGQMLINLPWNMWKRYPLGKNKPKSSENPGDTYMGSSLRDIPARSAILRASSKMSKANGCGWFTTSNAASRIEHLFI